MPKIISLADAENPKVNESGALLPIHQATLIGGSDSTITIPSTPAISSTILGSGNTYYYDLEPDEIGRIDDLVFRFRVACTTADVHCLSPHQWFSRIILEAEKG